MDETQNTQYNQYNLLSEIHNVILVQIDGNVVACGGIKEYAPYVAEVKRVFVHPENRKQGLAMLIMEKLEELAKEKGFHRLILETGKPLSEAQNLYHKIGFQNIPNYGQYAKMATSVCMQKKIIDEING